MKASLKERSTGATSVLGHLLLAPPARVWLRRPPRSAGSTCVCRAERLR